VIRLFVGLTSLNLLCLLVAAALGYAVMFRGPAMGPYHQLAGALATIVCCAVHCVVFTYFIATAKWIQHAIAVKRLDDSLAAPTRSFKAQAFPAAMLAMLVTFLAAVVGVMVFSYGIRGIWHHLLAQLAIAVNLVMAFGEYGAIRRNGLLIDQILMEIERIDRASARSGGSSLQRVLNDPPDPPCAPQGSGQQQHSQD